MQHDMLVHMFKCGISSLDIGMNRIIVFFSIWSLRALGTKLQCSKTYSTLICNFFIYSMYSIFSEIFPLVENSDDPVILPTKQDKTVFSCFLRTSVDRDRSCPHYYYYISHFQLSALLLDSHVIVSTLIMNLKWEVQQRTTHL